MKKTVLKVATMMLILALAILPLSVSATEGELENSLLQNYSRLLQKGDYSLYFDSDTAEIVVTSPEGVWRSNPIDADKSTKEKSQIIVYYYENRDLTAIDSFTGCISGEDKLDFEVSDDVLTVMYDIGDDAFTADALPTVLTKERMEKDILPALDEKERETVLKRFSLYERKKLDKNALKTVSLSFPSIEKYDLYIRSKMPDYIAEEIYELFAKAGYTSDDLQRDCDQNGIENTYKPKPSFHIELEYSITNDGFKVYVDTKKITYNPDYKPCRIEILPYFGAGVNEEAFMLVPDGCGAIIEFDNGKYNSSAYWKRFFNTDNALITEETEAESVPSVLPVFAISKSQGGFLATIDSGYEVAGISADVAGGNNTYNYVHAFFDIFSSDLVSLSSNEQDKFILTGERILGCPIEISYHFTGESPTYSDFALLYRDVLKSNGLLGKKRNNETEINLDLIGTAQITKRFLGVPYKTVASLTTYKQAKNIVEKLDGKVSVNFIDSLKGGKLQYSASNLKLQSVLGKARDKAALQKKVETLSVAYYGQYATSIKKKDSAMTMSKSRAMLYNYDLISRYVNGADALGVIATSKLNNFAKQVSKSAKKNGIDAVTLMDLGYNLNSNFASDAFSDRYDARVAIQKYIKTISKTTEVSVNVGATHTLALVDKIKDIPVSSSGYHIEDYTVPFYQIAISGYVPYTVPSINLAADSTEQFLRAVELGAQLQFSWCYSLPDNLAGNGTEYYKYLYENSIKDSKAFCFSYLPLYKKIMGQSILSHSKIGEQQYKIEYENGVLVYVNYADTVVSIDGVEIAPKNFTYSK